MTPLCNRCLASVNSSADFEASWREGGLIYQDHHPIGHPDRIIQWYEAIMTKSCGDATFSYLRLPRVLTPVSTWHGDPVCESHLFALATS